MVTALPPQDYIYRGVWTNFLRGGKVFGTTLTVSPDVASVLSPALALIISITGSQLWRLFQFALHQTRATEREKNFLFHQQQVTLRNTSTDLNTLWRLLRLAFAWRRHTDVKVVWESFPLLLWTSVHLTLVILFGIFSSWLLQAHDDVLSRSPWCGRYSQDFINTVYNGPWDTDAILEATFLYSNYKNSIFATAQQHLDVCQTSFEGCNVLITNTLNYTKTVIPGACPFPDSICHPNASNVEFDTGYLSSARHLGLNAPPQDRISFRMQAQCAPLDDARYVTGWQPVDASSDLPAHQVSDAHYGPGVTSLRNATFSYTKPVMECDQEAVLLPYVLDSVYSFAGVNDATFDPIPQLRPNNADVSLIMLMSNSHYYSPVVDPWFSAQLPDNLTGAGCRGGNRILYTRETPLTTIGCTQKWQICNAESPKTGDSTICTPLEGIYQVVDAFNSSSKLPASFNTQQLATVDWILNVARPSTFFYLIYALAQTTGAPIKARNLITGTVGMSVPDTQWQTEVDYWMQGLLAYLQQSSIDFNTGQFAFDTQYINVTTPAMDVSGAAYRLCQNQIIHSTTYRNFNFFALLLCLILCVIVTILGLTIEDIIGYIRQQRYEKIDYVGKKDMWFINSDLEMLRTITELKKKLRWSRSSFGIPFAPVGAKAGLDDLRSGDLDRGHGLKSTSYDQRGTATTFTSSPNSQRAYDYGCHQGTKSCATCESYELVSAGSHSTLPKPSPNDQGQVFYYADALLSQRPHLDRALSQIDNHSAVLGIETHPRPDIRPLQPSQTQQLHGYDKLHSNEFVQPTLTHHGSSFLYSNDIPSSNSLSVASIYEQDEHGIPMLVSDDSSDITTRTRARFGLGRDDAAVGTHVGHEIQEDKADRSWLWSRKQDTTGTIC